MTVLIANNVSSSLAAPISASATSMTVVSGTRFPVLTAGQYFYATIIASTGTIEIVKVTVRSGNAMNIIRAQDGTNAQAFLAGARVEMRINAASVREIVSDQNTPLEARLTTAEGEIDALQAADIALDARLDTAEAEIDVLQAFDTTLGTSAGSNSVGFLQSGTGAAARTVQDKLRDTVSVKDFGAIGDGINDDTDEIQAALNSGKSVYFPSGTYKITNTLTISSINRQHIYGEVRNSILSYSAPSNGAQLFTIGVNRDNILIEKLDFVNTNSGSKNDISAFVVNSTTNTVRWSYCGFYNFDRYCVQLANAMYYVFEYCTFVDISGNLTNTWSANAILATGFYNAITVRNCRFDRVDKAIVFGSGANEGAAVRIEDCTFEGRTTNTYASSGSYISLTKVRSLKITGNYFEALDPQTGYAAVEMDNCHAINISTNVFSGDFGGVRYTETFLYFVNGCTAVTCENNWFNEMDIYVARNFSSTQPIKFYRNYYVRTASPITDYSTIMSYFSRPVDIELDVSYSFSWDPGNLVDGAGETSLAQTVAGIAFGDMLLVSASSSLQGILAQGFVVAANTAQIRVQNETGSTIDLSNDTWRIRVIKQI